MGQCISKKNVENPPNLKPRTSRKSRKERRKSRRSKKSTADSYFSNPSTTQAMEERAPLSPKKMKKSTSTSSSIANSAEAIHPEDINPETFALHYGNLSHMTDDSTHNVPSHRYSDSSNMAPPDDTGDTSNHDTHNDNLTLLTDSPTSERRIVSPMRSMFNSPKPLSGPRVLFKSPLAPKQLAFRREKNNSTSSLFIKDTINSPDVDEILRCMAVALLYHLKNGIKADFKLDNIFSELYHPLTRESLDLMNLPDVATIFRFINTIFRVQKLPPECCILSLAYIEKILIRGQIALHPVNWRRIVFSAIMLATKVWEDESVWNVDFLDVFPLLTIIDLNNLENRFLELLQFNVIITGSEYAKYYFELRALSQLDSFPLEPLNREAQSKLEERSQRTNAKVSSIVVRDVTPKRCRSVDKYDPKSPPVTLH